MQDNSEKEMLRKFEDLDYFFKDAKRIDEFKACHSIYDLFCIEKDFKSFSEIEEKKFDKFIATYSGRPGLIYRDISKVASARSTEFKNILKNDEHRRKFNEYLRDNDPNIKILEIKFDAYTKYDKELDSQEKGNLKSAAKELNITDDEVQDVIKKWLDEKKVVEVYTSSNTSSDSSSDEVRYDKLLNETYYQILGVSEYAEYAEIKKAHDAEYQIYNRLGSSHKINNARWMLVSQAWECLKNPDRKRDYDKELKEKREGLFTNEGNPKLEIKDEKDNEVRQLKFNGMRKGFSKAITLIGRNSGGGTLDAKICTSNDWLVVDIDNVHQGKLPQRINIKISSKKSSQNHFGGKDKGYVEFTYQQDSKIQSEKIHVEFSIEIKKSTVARFRKAFIPTCAFLGGILGFYFHNVIDIRIADLYNLVLLLGSVVVAGKYANDSDESIFGYGCGTLIVGFIFLLILEKWFPHALSTASWAGGYGLVAYVSSKQIVVSYWKQKNAFPISVGLCLIIFPLVTIIISPYLAVPELEMVAQGYKNVTDIKSLVERQISGGFIGTSSSVDSNAESRLLRIFPGVWQESKSKSVFHPDGRFEVLIPAGSSGQTRKTKWLIIDGYLIIHNEDIISMLKVQIINEDELKFEVISSSSKRVPKKPWSVFRVVRLDKITQ